MTVKTKKTRVVSGMRPTGKLHLGHYYGVLQNWLQLQETYECYFFVADWHALTTEYAHPALIRQSTEDMILDWLAVGLNPQKSVIFVQSHVKAHAELHLLLSMLTPLGWLERVPSYKDMQNELKDKEISTHGFLGYPLLQAADVALYGGEKVPVGLDQVPHIELAREIVRRFNHLYGEHILVEPQPLLTPISKLLGMDRRKMSKSYDNCLYLGESGDTLGKKIRSAITDPARVRRDDPGHPEVCLVFDYQKLYQDPQNLQQIESGCRGGTFGCVACKKELFEKINHFLQPIREKRQELAGDREWIRKMLREGAEKATAVAESTMKKIREVMGL